MTTSARQPKGIPVGGQFAATAHSEPSVALNGPRIDAGYVASVLGALPWHRTTSAELTEEIVKRLNGSRNFSDQNVTDTADAVWRETYGYTAKEETNFQFALDTLRAAGEEDAATDVQNYLSGRLKKSYADGATNGRHSNNPYDVPTADVYSVSGTNTRLHFLNPDPVPDGVTTPVPASDRRLQAGDVFDKVQVGGTLFTRTGALDYPNDPQSMRFQANRPLNDAEAYALSGVIGYANSSAIGGEPLDDPAVGPQRDSPYSFVVNIDTNKGRQRNYDKFEDMIPDIIAHGTKPRSTQGWTRAIDPFWDSDLKLEVYYGD